MRARHQPLERLVVTVLWLAIGSCSRSDHERDPAPSATSELASTAPGAATEVDVGRAVAIAREIDRNPNRATEVLERHEVTAAEFGQLMYDIAGDPELAEAYETARR